MVDKLDSASISAVQKMAAPAAPATAASTNTSNSTSSDSSSTAPKPTSSHSTSSQQPNPSASLLESLVHNNVQQLPNDPILPSAVATTAPSTNTISAVRKPSVHGITGTGAGNPPSLLPPGSVPVTVISPTNAHFTTSSAASQHPPHRLSIDTALRKMPGSLANSVPVSDVITNKVTSAGPNPEEVQMLASVLPQSLQAEQLSPPVLSRVGSTTPSNLRGVLEPLPSPYSPSHLSGKTVRKSVSYFIDCSTPKRHHAGYRKKASGHSTESGLDSSHSAPFSTASNTVLSACPYTSSAPTISSFAVPDLSYNSPQECDMSQSSNAGIHTPTPSDHPPTFNSPCSSIEIALLSPPVSHDYKPSTLHFHVQSSSTLPLKLLISTVQPFSQQPQPTRMTLAELSHALASAAARRSDFFEKRTNKLRRHSEMVKYRNVIKRQKDKLVALKARARTEYALSAAALKRQLILKKYAERCGAAVEHALTVAMVQRLKKVLELRKAFSDTLLTDFLPNAQPTGARAIEGNIADSQNIESRAKSPPLSGTLRGAPDSYVMNKVFPEDLQASPHSVAAAAFSAAVATFPEGRNGPAISKDALAESVSVLKINDGIGCAAGDGADARVNVDLGNSVTERRRPSLASLTILGAVSTTNHSLPPSAAPLSLGKETELPNGPTAVKSVLENVAILSPQTPQTPPTSVAQRPQFLPHMLEDMEESDYQELLDLLPPVTRFTLRELDLDEILTNPQLRHDLYFDPHLQFKPNTDGDRGVHKQLRLESYWNEVESEVLSGRLFRIPLLLFEVRCIMLELLPFSMDLKDEIERNLDIRLIAQQLEHSVFQPIGLIEYLATLLKANCAPARDELLDSMVAECVSGNFARTLRICFEVLELMKLDYANHQLHRLRPYVVDHAIEFEWRWFKEQLDTGGSDVQETSSWLREGIQRHKDGKALQVVPTPSTEMFKPPKFPDLYAEGLMHIIQQSSSFPDVTIPETMKMDSTRLVTFYNDWQDITIMASLLIIFKQACGTPKPVSSEKGAETAAKVPTIQEAKNVLWILLNDAETSMVHITLQMASMAGQMRGKPLDERERELLAGLVDKTLSPDSKLYEIVQKRIAQNILAYLVSWSSTPKPAPQPQPQVSSDVERRETEESAPEEADSSSDSEDDSPVLSLAQRRQIEMERKRRKRLEQQSLAVGASSSSLSSSQSSLSITQQQPQQHKPTGDASLHQDVPSEAAGAGAKAVMSERKLDQAMLSRHGLLELEAEIVDLGKRIDKMAEHNRAVYAPVYSHLYEELALSFTVQELN
ncbi:T-complex protein 11-domain-containing protein [Cladochytrium replicatum]|nr:T-complex protein 11-domain-containing protein [Cladochytrium replicatum]